MDEDEDVDQDEDEVDHEGVSQDGNEDLYDSVDED